MPKTLLPFQGFKNNGLSRVVLRNFLLYGIKNAVMSIVGFRTGQKMFRPYGMG